MHYIYIYIYMRASGGSVAASFSRAEPAGREVVEVMPPAETARPRNAARRKGSKAAKRTLTPKQRVGATKKSISRTW